MPYGASPDALRAALQQNPLSPEGFPDLPLNTSGLADGNFTLTTCVIDHARCAPRPPPSHE